MNTIASIVGWSVILYCSGRAIHFAYGYFVWRRRRKAWLWENRPRS